MKYCMYCEAQVEDNADDCPSCGSEITKHKKDTKSVVEVPETVEEPKPKKKGK